MLGPILILLYSNNPDAVMEDKKMIPVSKNEISAVFNSLEEFRVFLYNDLYLAIPLKVQYLSADWCWQLYSG